MGRTLVEVTAPDTDRTTGADGERMTVVFLDHVATLSGGEIALVRLVGCLTEVDAHVILGQDGPLRGRLEAVGATVEVMPLDPRTRDAHRRGVARGLDGLRAAVVTLVHAARLARRLRVLRPDLVHANSLKSGFYGSIAARMAGVPVVWHVRDRVAEDYLGPRATALVRTALRVLPLAVVANSAETLRTTGCRPGSGSVRVAEVVHDPYRHERSSARVTSGDGVVVGMVGRLAPWKGQHVLLEALAEPGLGGVRARVVGSAMFAEDEYAAALLDLADRLGISDRVTFTGFVVDVAAELATVDVLVHASVLPEPFGQVVVEGMAAGLAVVAADAGGPREIITSGVDGVLVPPGSVPALAEALRTLVADPAERSRLGTVAARSADRFAPEVVARTMLALYARLVPSYASPAHSQ